MNPLYQVVFFKTRFFSGTVDGVKMENYLNKMAASGYNLERTIHEKKRVLIFFSREIHILIFRLVQEDATPALLRQLLRAYGHEPEA